MNRREALRQLCVLVGATMTASTAAGLFAGCGPGQGFVPRTLSGDQHALLGRLVQIILPATDTPGAGDVGVHDFIDLLLTDWMKDADRDRFVAGLSAIPDGDDASLTQSLISLEADAPDGFFGDLKRWTLVAYYTSEVGATQELRYERLPGRYGDVPFDEVGRTWA